MPCRPKSRISCALDGHSTGIPTAARIWSEKLVIVEDLAPWSSPAMASTPPQGLVPALLAWRRTSPERSTPGPLPYQMPNTPSYFAAGDPPTCWLPHSAVAARSSLTAARKVMWCAASRSCACHISMS